MCIAPAQKSRPEEIVTLGRAGQARESAALPGWLLSTTKRSLSGSSVSDSSVWSEVEIAFTVDGPVREILVEQLCRNADFISLAS
jgi:hypothetical protein